MVSSSLTVLGSLFMAVAVLTGATEFSSAKANFVGESLFGVRGASIRKAIGRNTFEFGHGSGTTD
jgi:hypothetical protein